MVDEQEPAPSDDSDMNAFIGKQLKTMYDSVLSEPLPDKIVELLVKLDGVTLPSGDGNKSSESQ